MVMNGLPSGVLKAVGKAIPERYCHPSQVVVSLASFLAVRKELPSYWQTISTAVEGVSIARSIAQALDGYCRWRAWSAVTLRPGTVPTAFFVTVRPCDQNACRGKSAQWTSLMYASWAAISSSLMKWWPQLKQPSSPTILALISTFLPPTSGVHEIFMELPGVATLLPARYVGPCPGDGFGRCPLGTATALG